jgi:fructose-specific phosphotransferase system IIC component
MSAWPDWFTPIFIIAVIDWLVVENLFLWLMYREMRKLRKELKEALAE